MGKEVFGTAFGSSSSAVHRRPQAAIPPILIAEGRLLRVGLCQLFFNLQARAPLGRPPCSFSAAVHIDSDPSGPVPGVGEDGRDLRHQSVLGGEGPDSGCIFRSMVLFAFLEGLCVTCFLFGVLLVSCNPTDNI